MQNELSFGGALHISFIFWSSIIMLNGYCLIFVFILWYECDNFIFEPMIAHYYLLLRYDLTLTLLIFMHDLFYYLIVFLVSLISYLIVTLVSSSLVDTRF